MRAVGIEPHHAPADDVPEDDETVEPTEPTSLLLPPEEFYNSRPTLRVMRDYAHSRGAPADPVLYGVLARISAMVPPECRVETGIGSSLGASLNLFAAPIGPPGTGKSSSADVARDLYPRAVSLDFMDSLPLGTGEGIAEAYMGWEEVETGETYRTGKSKGEPRTKQVRTQVRHNAFFVADEGEVFAKYIERQGAIVGPAIRSAWYGQTLGQQNAEEQRRRFVPAGSYAMGMLIGFQPETVLPLLRDAAAGTPQRFVYCFTVDPTAPATPTLVEILPKLVQAPSAKMPLAPAIAGEIWRNHHDRRTGAVEVLNLDAHADLTKVKLAALLALLEGRQAVSEEDWRLAGIMWGTSCRVRDHYLARAKIAEARERQAKNRHYANREEMAEVARLRVREESAKVVRVARLIAKYVHDPVKPERTIPAAIRRLDSPLRDLGEQAVAYAGSEGWVEVDGNDLSPGLSRPAESDN
jgi:hypothetical protein